MVSESPPATPASIAITNDQMSGWTMNDVSSPRAASATDTSPTSRPRNHIGVATTSAIRKPTTSVRTACGCSEIRGRRASARQIAATGE